MDEKVLKSKLNELVKDAKKKKGILEEDDVKHFFEGYDISSEELDKCYKYLEKHGINVLILDEPTNHLDMEAITSLNNAVIKFPGVVLFTSQDHQFIQTIANRIMEITPNGLIDKVGTYDEYLESDEMARKRQIMTISEEELAENEGSEEE